MQKVMTVRAALRSISLSFALLLCLFAMPARSQDPAGGPPPRSAAHVVSIDAESFDDLAFLRPLLSGKRIVQLGENTHGVKEYNLAKARIVRFLHQEMGFEVLAFESDFYQCHDANRSAAEAPAVSTLTNCLFGVWHTKEVLPLFAYLRASYGTERPLHLAGFDVQPIGRNKAGRPGFLAVAAGSLRPSYAAEIFTLDSTFLAVYARGGRERRAFFRSDDGRRMAQDYEEFAAALAEGPSSGIKDVVAARQTARSLMWYVRQQAAPTTRAYVEHRDEGMAENLSILLEELYPGRKIVVWGHNFHLRHNNLRIPPDTSTFPDVATRTAGTWMRERYGEELYTVGLYAYRGRAANNRGEIFEIPPARESSLEASLRGMAPVFIDLTEARRDPALKWMAEPTTARFNGTTPLSMKLPEQYDAILLFDEVTAREPF